MLQGQRWLPGPPGRPPSADLGKPGGARPRFPAFPALLSPAPRSLLFLSLPRPSTPLTPDCFRDPPPGFLYSSFSLFILPRVEPHSPAEVSLDPSSLHSAGLPSVSFPGPGLYPAKPPSPPLLSSGPRGCQYLRTTWLSSTHPGSKHPSGVLWRWGPGRRGRGPLRDQGGRGWSQGFRAGKEGKGGVNACERKRVSGVCGLGGARVLKSMKGRII